MWHKVLLKKIGEDYDESETFCPVVRHESIRTLIALSVQNGLKLHQMDITTAFLNGELLYLSVATRPDIAFAVSNVAKYCAKPTKQHWIAVKRIMRYLKGTLNYGLCYTSSHNTQCVGFSDADFAGDTDDRKSTTGYMFKMSGTAISWRSKKQTCVALSTAEAEYIALASAGQETVWIRQLLSDMRSAPTGPTVILKTTSLPSPWSRTRSTMDVRSMLTLNSISSKNYLRRKLFSSSTVVLMT